MIWSVLIVWLGLSSVFFWAIAFAASRPLPPLESLESEPGETSAGGPECHKLTLADSGQR